MLFGFEEPEGSQDIWTRENSEGVVQDEMWIGQGHDEEFRVYYELNRKHLEGLEERYDIT